ncbi:Orotidine 5'-phosphate decarboxylase [Pseudonocardia sp. Ae406_Ps2]|uniref:orotidine-5'-phosphate decarboxylase n=1 Tax=unclassified Pseudonocardia TaxID=2619320 RepID=UPI00094ADEB9|nr:MULTISPECIES: orotidine-5'-phosphate decarboxylase [unclassified Pseudonocardia]OLM00652.1 Orotidine 5'-phosphate decarboxylase [Pseudonocardia sp. Ae406_Ps2]OLM07558.1 Orotidine 5'-phosphate decarboxylase [Pseudonocardia sp. Ae331_Ps2]OLM14745.1 Orotidine 5'-phosphate decarboxylase [Pseudonocardia sp. Ae505_Ps2]OLM22224.1 Orotidine 5'-phosphate decarboxylase [Pseudonocardia sp. Ae706_Ps2]OLM31895.1 Orotidine 5'-phosphate decarboxylase [Pseudonocardia sp. Ae717_Ps2]
MSIAARLGEAVAAHGPLCVGIDPHPALLAAWDLTDDADGLAAFADRCHTAFAGAVSVVKPQSAFFERHGSAGVAVLERLLAGYAGTGTLTLLDAKRGDIGSTMDGYADAYLRVGAPLGADALTLSPYLGFGSLEPALTAADEAGRGVFVLARTSNPDGAAVQCATAPGGVSVAQQMVDEAAARNAGAQPGGAVGVVVGGTHDHGLDLSALNGPVLVPGLGAQGASPADVVARFAGTTGPVLPVSARGVLRAGPDPSALRDAAHALSEELASATAGSH